MSPARSLRRDLALGFGLGILAAWLVALVLGWTVLRGEIDEIYDAALTRTADRLLALSGEADGTPGPGALLAEITAADGRVLLRTEAAGPETFAQAGAEGFSRANDLRFFTLRTPDGTLLRVADPLSERREAAREALTALLLPSLVLVPLALFAASRFTRRRLAPVTALSAEVAGRDAADLRPLAAGALPEELEPIRAAVDTLMARLSEALAAERSFSSNAAHELRTPIAATLAQAQRLIAEADGAPLRARAEAVAAELRRIARLAEKLLELARAEGAPPPDLGAQDMAPVLRLVLRDFPALEAEIQPGPVPVRMDIDAFAVLARNLVENALVHGTAPVRVALDAAGLTVENGGAPVPAALLGRLTQRFERAGSRRAGSGLGLAIVEKLAQRAGARLELVSPLPGTTGGFRAAVLFARGGKQDG